jgi:DnaJ domain/Exodeoxyribonuclease X-like C-terminal
MVGRAGPKGAHRYTWHVPRRNPHDVLGVPRGAAQATIKAAWRKLARAHHPDLTPDDPAATEKATRRMAEINRAYAELRAGFPPDAAADGDGNGRGTWPPAPPPTRPVTGRVDTSATFRPHNTTTGPRLRHAPRPPATSDRLRREPLRASDPNGPLSRRRQRNFRPPEPPSLEVARAWPVEFGKFHGHSLGEIAEFEPTYIDWLARTIARDPDLVAAARVVQDDLDVRGITRRPRPVPL